MKKLFLGLMAILIICIGEVNAQAYREVDKFTGKTTIYSTKKRITMLRSKALYFYIGEEWTEYATENPEMTVISGVFQEWGHRRWKYLKYHTLIFLVDGESIRINEVDHDGVIDPFGTGHKLAEYVTFRISWTNFIKLLDADKVEYRLGAYERKLKSKVLKEMRSFKDLILKISKTETS